MRDIHSHIIYGVDDGSETLKQSLEMLQAAEDAGVTQIVCTPHCQSRHFDAALIKKNFEELKRHTESVDLVLGYEVRLEKLLDLGIERAHEFCFEGSDEFLLELSSSLMPANWERVLCCLQEQGLRVIIAHPERYRYIQADISIAERMMRNGCILQLSANFAQAGRLNPIYRCAKKLLDAGYVVALASDAHVSEDYWVFKTVFEKYEHNLMLPAGEYDGKGRGDVPLPDATPDSTYQPKHQRMHVSAYRPELCTIGL